ncbi:MAG TPA: rRNA pseudouridine synthase, partial [Candidatus Acetothermia bacterium]|nr:rRNA pseudouridine synthase [Candidatus Acetothermia bacterium]
LQAAGVASRRKVDELIQAGQVWVNGRRVTKPWHQVDPARDRVEVAGRLISLPTEKHYLKLYKPRGVTSTLADPHAGRTLAEFVPPGLRLFPVGRLDRDSEGLVLLTDDGELAYFLTHPRFEVKKRYQVELNRPLARRDLARLRAGISLEDGPFRPELLATQGNLVELSISEGRKREIRRGFSALGYRVLRLVRLAIGPLELGGLRPGEVVSLSPQERELLLDLLKKLKGG